MYQRPHIKRNKNKFQTILDWFWYHLGTISMHFDGPIRKSVLLTWVEIHHYGRNRQKICQCTLLLTKMIFFLDLNVYLLFKNQTENLFYWFYVKFLKYLKIEKIFLLFEMENIFAIWNRKKIAISKWQNFCHFVFHRIEKTSSALDYPIG